MKNNLCWPALAVLALVLVAEVIMTSPARASSKAKGNFAVGTSTKIDFEETLIEGKMQAPNGFFLQGRTPQALRQMVRLRSNFRSELRNSKSGVQALAK